MTWLRKRTMSEVSDISKESVIQRVIRDNALAALMVVLAFVSMVNGIIIGVSIAVMINNTSRVEALQRQFEINAAWQGRLIGYVQAAGIEVPPQPIEED